MYKFNSKLSFSILIVLVFLVSSFFVFGDIKTDAKNEGYHKTLYTDSVESADASGDVVEVVDTFRVVDDDNPIDFYDVGVSGGKLSVQESGSNAVLTLSDTEVMVNGSDGLCFGGTCVSDWPHTCGADEAVSWDSGAQEFGCMNISQKIDNEVTTLSAGDAIRIDSNDNIDVKYGDGLTLNGDTLTIDSSACGAGQVLSYTGSGFTCVSGGTDKYLPDDPATSSVNMQGNPVQNLPSPSDSQDAVRKEYVDKQEISMSSCSWSGWTVGEVASGPEYCANDEVMQGVEVAGENDAGETDCDDHEPNDANAWCVRAYCCTLQVNYVPDVVASIDYSDKATSSGIPFAYDVGADVSNTGTDSDTFDVTITGKFTNSTNPLGCATVSDTYTDTVTLGGGSSTSVSSTLTGNTNCPELNQIDISMVAQSASSSDFCSDYTPVADGKSC